VVASTLSLAFPDSAAGVLAVVNAGLAHGAKLCVDINWRPVFWANTHGGEAAAKIAVMKIPSPHYFSLLLCSHFLKKKAQACP